MDTPTSPPGMGLRAAATTAKAGVVCFIGRPNAGKSTLLNRLVGHRLAIVSDKPQTTRTRLLGVKNYEAAQVVFVDTPGVHKPTHRMNARMVESAMAAIDEVDVLLLVVDASVKPGPGDRFVLEAIGDTRAPVILVLTKVDLIAKTRLLPLIEHYHAQRAFAEIIPISALDGTNVEALEAAVLAHLPAGLPLYPADYVTDQSEYRAIAEIVREQVLGATREELPFATAVILDRVDVTPSLTSLHCTIVVDRPSQKPIVVGRGGAMIKHIGTAARLELERYLETKVFLDLHVKVRADWRDDERALDELGIGR